MMTSSMTSMGGPNSMPGGGMRMMGGMGGGMGPTGDTMMSQSSMSRGPGNLMVSGSGPGMGGSGPGGVSGAMIRPGMGQSGMRMPMSNNSAPPPGSLPISQNQSFGQSMTSSTSSMSSSMTNSSMSSSMTNSMSSSMTTTVTTSSTQASSNLNPSGGGGTDSSTGNDTTTQQPKAEPNTITICRIGQETVEEIVNRTLELFTILKTLQPPSPQMMQNDKQNKSRIQEILKVIGVLMKRLRVCWEKSEENTCNIEHPPLINLIPLKDDSDPNRSEIEKKRGENYRAALEEHNELIQQIILKNRHLKDIIDQMRNTIWEINTMLAMRT